MSDIRIGISGWRYAPWRKHFYPAGLVQRRELEYASRAVNSIEINGSFYALQTPERYANWHNETPDDFVFSVKAPRYITHIKRLQKDAYLDIPERHHLRHAVEIRNQSFVNDKFIELLSKYKVALVVADTAGKRPYVEDVTSDFIYMRLHGDEELYSSGYSEAALKRWQRRSSAGFAPARDHSRA